MGRGFYPADMTGFSSGLLTVIKRAANKNFRDYWECRCECGNTHVAMGKLLRSNLVKSCGCLKIIEGRSRATHGHSRLDENGKTRTTPTYKTWQSMIRRCESPGSKDYAAYGAQGIRICERWHKFENFLADMGERPNGTTIDRLENSKGYEPGNCRWATPREQTLNRGFTRLITFNGETLCMSDWARRLNIKPGRLHYRLKAWPIEKALTTQEKGED